MIKIFKTIFFLFLFLPIVSNADTCFRTFEDDTTEAKAIFVGKVVKISDDEFWFKGYAMTIFTFQVIESFKGMAENDGFISLIGPIHGCCNEHFRIDSTFLVFAYGDCKKSTFLWTNDCSNTGLLSQKWPLYKRLGVSIKHSADQDQFEVIYADQIKMDSLNTSLKRLKIQNKRIELEVNELKLHRILLLSIFGIISLFLILRTIKGRK